NRRSHEAMGIELEQQTKIVIPAQDIEVDGAEAADRADMHREIVRNNGERIIADPSIALDAITHQQSTFTRRDMAMFAHRHSDGLDQFNDVMGAMGNAPDLVELERDKVEILNRLAEAPADVPDVHPNIASVYRRNVERFTE